MTERDVLQILNAIPRVGNSTIFKLIGQYGSAKAAFEAGHKIKAISDFDAKTFLEKEKYLQDQKGVEVISFFDEKYPKRLKEIPDAPVVLYVKGQLPQGDDWPIGVVGSRRASVYGMTTARQFSARLSECGITIISGMAKGIDTAAHRGVLDAGGQTIAVLGSGLGDIYPRENVRLFHEIAENGAVISEFPISMPPLAYNFPRRNRIISGLSFGVIVMEAAARSGALITADFALEQGREVYAVPGHIGNPSSQGVHNLIKQGAKLVTSVEDVLQDLKPQLLGEAIVGEKGEEGLDDLLDDEKRIYNFIGKDPINFDTLLQRCSYTPAVAGAVLCRLELKKKIKQLPGKCFKR